jgi:hypothetical protein
MAMRIDQTWQESALAEVNQRSGTAGFDLVEFSNLKDFISANFYGAIPNGRSIHRYDGAGANDHSAFTTCRHAATKRLHAS